MALVQITTKILKGEEWEENNHPTFIAASQHALASMVQGATDMRTYLNGEEISNEIFFSEMKKELDAGMQ